MSYDVSAYFEERIETCRGASGRALERALSGLLRDFERQIRSWARAACRAHGDRRLSHLDDVANVIAYELSLTLREQLVASEPPRVVNFYAYFRRIAERRAFAYFHSPEHTGFGAASGAARRASKINKTRRELAIASGRQPSDAEVVAEVNRLARLTRSDPRKQGALVTLDDVRPPVVTSLDGLVESFGDTFADALDDEDAPISRVEARALVARIVDACRGVSPVLGEVAACWIGDALAEPPVIRDPGEIRETLALARGEALDLLDGCRLIATTICEREYGMSSPFV